MVAFLVITSFFVIVSRSLTTGIALVCKYQASDGKTQTLELFSHTSCVHFILGKHVAARSSCLLLIGFRMPDPDSVPLSSLGTPKTLSLPLRFDHDSIGSL